MDPARALSLPPLTPRLAWLQHVRALLERLGRDHADYWPTALLRLRRMAVHVAGPASDEAVARFGEHMRRQVASDMLRLNWDWCSQRHPRPALFPPGATRPARLCPRPRRSSRPPEPPRRRP